MTQIDADIHIWNQSHGEELIACNQFPVLTGCEFLPDHMAAMLQETGSEKAVRVHGPASDRHTDYCLALAQQHACILSVVGWLDAGSPEAAQRVDALGRHRAFRGVRLTPRLTPDPAAYLQSAQTMQALAHLSRHGHLVEFIVDTALLPHVLRIARALPELTIVIDHCGLPPVKGQGWSPWAEHIADLGALPSVWTKLAGLREQAGSPAEDAQLRRYLRHVVDCFGYARLVYASNWPVVTAVGGAKAWAEQLRRLLGDWGMTPEETGAVWGGMRCGFVRPEDPEGSKAWQTARGIDDEGDAASEGRRLQCPQGARFVPIRVGVSQPGLLHLIDQHAPAREPLHQSGDDRVQQRVQFVACGRSYLAEVGHTVATGRHIAQVPNLRSSYCIAPRSILHFGGGAPRRPLAPDCVDHLEPP